MDKTRTEYAEIKARWSAMPGKVDDEPYVEDGTKRNYRYLTLRESVGCDLATVLGALARLGTVAIQDNAYLTMNIHKGDVTVQVGVATYDVDATADDFERHITPSERAWKATPDAPGVTPDERAGLGVEG